MLNRKYEFITYSYPILIIVKQLEKKTHFAYILRIMLAWPPLTTCQIN